jgi:hypothetical protein
MSFGGGGYEKGWLKEEFQKERGLGRKIKADGK